MIILRWTRHPPRLSFPVLQPSSRSYALSVAPSVTYPRISGPRVYSKLKTFRYHQYTRFLEASVNCPIIFLQHTNFTAQGLIKLRREIEDASQRALPSLATPAPNPAPIQSPTLTVLRTSIFGVALRDFSSVPLEESAKLAQWLKGSLAALMLPSLHPPQLDAVLRALDRAVPPKKPKTEQELAQELALKNADPATPGRRVKRQRPVLTPELKLIGALIEGRIFAPEGVQEVAKLQALDTIREQIVGLLSSPSRQLAAVLSQAGGGKLIRSLEGLKINLEEGRDGSSAK